MTDALVYVVIPSVLQLVVGFGGALIGARALRVMAREAGGPVALLTGESADLEPAPVPDGGESS